MAIRIRLGGVELARTRFAISPVYETVMALAVLNRPGVHAVHLPWVRWARQRLAGLPDLDLLLDLVGDDLMKPAFLMPPPDARMPDLDHELRRVRATPTARVRANLDRLHVQPSRVRQLYADPRAGLRAVTVALAACHERLIAPHWTRVVRILEADIAYRATLLAEGGIQRLFADLHGEVTWSDGELVIHRSRPPHDSEPIKLGGHGLVLCASAFCWPRVTTATRPTGEGTLRYPARGVATIWEQPQPASDAIAALIGRNRAALLTALTQPMTTADLATRLGVTPGAISQHLNVLRAAGLVTTNRDARTILHLRTDRADTLLGSAR